MDFGAELLYKVKPTAKLEKRNSRWEFGIFGGKEEGGVGRYWLQSKARF